MKQITRNFYCNNYKKQILEIQLFINNKVFFLKHNILKNKVFKAKILMSELVFNQGILWACKRKNYYFFKKEGCLSLLIGLINFLNKGFLISWKIWS